MTGPASRKSATFVSTVRDLASGETAQLQRTFGTARTWGRVVGLAARTNATVTATALGTLGAYAYRVAIVKAGKVLKATRPSITVYVYANVPLTPFGNGGGTEVVGGTVFSFTDQAGTLHFPNYQENRAFTATSCRSIRVQYAGDFSSQSQKSTSYLDFVQSSADPVSSSTLPGAITSVTVALDGGPLYIGTATSSGGDEIFIDFNITGSCYTVSGTR